MNRRKSMGWGVAIFIVVAVLVVGGCGVGCYQTQLKTGEVEFTVKSKERVAEDNSSKYLVFTDNGVYQVTDNLLYGLTESSDRYNALEEGKTYRCTTIGVRFSLFSWYRNLNKCEEVG